MRPSSKWWRTLKKKKRIHLLIPIYALFWKLQNFDITMKILSFFFSSEDFLWRSRRYLKIFTDILDLLLYLSIETISKHNWFNSYLILISNIFWNKNKISKQVFFLNVSTLKKKFFFSHFSSQQKIFKVFPPT